MGNWDDLDAELRGVDLGETAGEWAVIAMACVTYADGNLDASELSTAQELVTKTRVIRDSIGETFAKQLFLDTITRIQTDPKKEIEGLKDELRDLAGRIGSETDRNHAFHTLIVIATADHEIVPAEHELLTELKELIGAEILVPLPHLSV